MQEFSVFVAECLCGRTFETPSRDYVCPACNRHIHLEWGRDPDLKPEPDRAEQSAKETAA